MAKKSFNTINPAERFISIPEAEEPTPQRAIPAAPQGPNKPPKGYKVNPEYIETKSRRVQLLIQPSVYEAIKEKAQAQGQSVNNLINDILSDYVKEA